VRIAAALVGAAAIAACVGAVAVGAFAGHPGVRRAAHRPGPPPRVFAFLSRANGAELDHLRRYGPRLSVLAPNWYAVRSGAATLVGAPDPAVRALARRGGDALWPVVNAVGDGFTERPGALAGAIAGEAARRRYAGMTLDIEGVTPGDGAAFTAFVRAVAAQLHAAGRRLAVYVPGPGSTSAYPWGALVRAADLMIASGYDEHTSGSSAGAVTTARGFSRMLDAAAAVSTSRVAPAVGAIGFRWPAGGGAGTLMSSLDAVALLRASGARLHGAGGDAWFSLDGATVHFQTFSALVARAHDARDVGMRWLALFSLGREPDAFWARIVTARQAHTDGVARAALR
jgi:hypothetical protein